MNCNSEAHDPPDDGGGIRTGDERMEYVDDRSLASYVQSKFQQPPSSAEPFVKRFRSGGSILFMNGPFTKNPISGIFILANLCVIFR